MSALNRRHLHVFDCGASREAHDFLNVQNFDSRGGVSDMVSDMNRCLSQITDLNSVVSVMFRVQEIQVAVFKRSIQNEHSEKSPISSAGSALIFVCAGIRFHLRALEGP